MADTFAIDVTPMFSRLRTLCDDGEKTEAEKLARELADEPNCAVSRLVGFIKEAAKSDNEVMIVAARHIFQHLMADGDRKRALIISDMIDLGSSRVCTPLDLPLPDWWRNVIYPHFSDRRLDEQLVLMEMAVRDCQDGNEFYWIIGLVEFLPIPDRQKHSKEFADLIVAPIRELWNEGRLPKDIWPTFIAALKALIKVE